MMQSTYLRVIFHFEHKKNSKTNKQTRQNKKENKNALSSVESRLLGDEF